MRLLSVLLATLALTNVMAQTAAPDSFCVKYAKILFGKNDTTLTGTDELNLISAIVGRVVVGCDNNVATQFGISGVDPTTGTSPFRFYGKSACTFPNAASPLSVVKGLVADQSNGPFFAGSAPNYNSVCTNGGLNTAAGIGMNPSIRFVNVTGYNVTANPAATGTFANGALVSQGLIEHLVSFFARDFKCRFYNNATGVGAYQGNADMAAVHKNMLITNAVWSEFINTFNQTLVSFGVASSDISGTVVPYVSGFLLGGASGQICNDPATCACAPINGQAATVVNGTCVVTGGATTAPPATTSPPTTSAPTTHSSASTVAISAATIFGAVLLAFL